MNGQCILHDFIAGAGIHEITEDLDDIITLHAKNQSSGYLFSLTVNQYFNHTYWFTIEFGPRNIFHGK